MQEFSANRMMQEASLALIGFLKSWFVFLSIALIILTSPVLRRDSSMYIASYFSHQLDFYDK